MFIKVFLLKKFELHLDIVTPNTSIVDTLANACSLSINEIKQAIDKGALWHTKQQSTQRLRRLKKELNTGEQLHFYYDEKILSTPAPTALLIQDHTAYSIWYKPYGMLSQGSKWSDHCTISRWAEKALDRPCFIVHRLDRAASGLIIIAHTKTSARAFSQLFEQHHLEKHYQIIVHGKFEPQHQPVIETSNVGDKPAKSTFCFNQYSTDKNVSLIDVEIASGRKHQIRIHSASLGYPVVGDRLHGDESINYDDDTHLQLCAVKLQFQCPLLSEQRIIELPEHLRPQLNVLQIK